MTDNTRRLNEIHRVIWTASSELLAKVEAFEEAEWKSEFPDRTLRLHLTHEVLAEVVVHVATAVAKTMKDREAPDVRSSR